MNKFIELFRKKEVDEIHIEKSLEFTHDFFSEHINEEFDWKFNIAGVYIDETIHGKIYDDKIIYKIRPHFIRGLTYKTIIDFASTSQTSCKLTVIRNSLEYYKRLFLLLIALSIIIFSTIFFTTNEYKITIDGVSRIVEGHPYPIFIFPFIFSVSMIFTYFRIKSAKRNAEYFFKNILDELNELWKSRYCT